MEKITYFYITPEGSQEMMLARIKMLKWQRDCLHEQMSSMVERCHEHGVSENDTVFEELESEVADIEAAIGWERNRLIRLRGYDENGIPF